MVRSSRVLITVILLAAAACGGGSTPESTPEQVACSPAAPDGTCDAGLRCYVGTCTPEADFCSAGNPTGLCAAGRTCLDGTCVQSGELCSAANPDGACASGTTCRGGQCLDDAVFCSATVTEGLCADTRQSCIDGTCRNPQEICSAENPTGLCRAPLACRNGSCATESPCAADEPQGYCATGQSCLDGSCKSNADLCSADNTTGLCASGRGCIDGSCVADSLICSASLPAGLCATGASCLAGECVPLAQQCSPTNVTGRCAPSEACLDGDCIAATLVCSHTNVSGLCSTTYTCFGGDCVLTSSLCSETNTSGLCPDTLVCNAAGDCVPPPDACGCDISIETCIDGECRPNALICSETNPTGLCESGSSCIAGDCVDQGAGCSAANTTGVCPKGEICEAGDCKPLDGAALCDDGNACTRDSFDVVRNRCAHEPQAATCSDGNACTTDACVAGVCTGTPIGGCVAPPVIDAYVSPTNNPSFQLGGAKAAGAAIKINGTVAVTENPSTTWSVTRNLDPGANVFTVSSVSGGVESATVEVRVVYDNVLPVTSMSPKGGVFLDGVNVTIATSEPATVFYTTDGGTPDEFSPRFESVKEIRVFDDTVVRVRARDFAGNWEAAEVSGTFEITGDGNGWRNGPTLSAARTHAAAVTLGSRVYVVGGSNGTALQADAAAYDLGTDTWSTLPDLPGTAAARAELALVALDGKLYALGGRLESGYPVSAVSIFAAPSGTAWSNDTGMLSTRYGLAAVAYNGKIYAFGGKANGGAVLANVEVYTPGTPGSWVNTVAQMPRARYAFGAVEARGRIYLVGGVDGSGAPVAEVDVYDPASNTWSEEAPLPTPRSFIAVAVNRNVGAVDSGYVGIVAAGGLTVGGAPSAIVEELVLRDGEWRQRTPLAAPRYAAATAIAERTAPVDTLERQIWLIGGQTPAGLEPGVTVFAQEQDYVRRLADATPRFGHAAAALDGRIYLFGGRHNSEKKEAWSYDPETETFEELAPLPTFQNGLAAVAVGDRVYAIGGNDDNGFAVPTLRAFDPVLGAWDELTPMPTGRAYPAVAQVAHEIYVIGGLGEGQARQSVEIYDTLTDTWRTGTALPSEGRAGAMATAHHGDVYVFGGRNTAGQPTPSVLRLRAGAWSTLSGSIPAAYGTLVLVGDTQVSIFAGRDGAALTKRVWSYNVVAQSVDSRRTSSLLAAYDLSAAAYLNGDIYLLGGNASDNPVGPEGQALVQKVRGRCFDGVKNGGETAVDRGGGCSQMPQVFSESFATSTLNSTNWQAITGDGAIVSTPTHSASYSLNLGGGSGAVASQQFDTEACEQITWEIYVKRGDEAPDAGNLLLFEYWNGSSWTEITRVVGNESSDASFIRYNGTIADINARRFDARVRLRTQYGDPNSEDFFVDDIFFGCPL